MNAIPRRQLYYFILLFISLYLLFSITNTTQNCPLTNNIQHGDSMPAQKSLSSLSIDIDPHPRIMEAETDIEVEGHHIKYNKLRPQIVPNKLKIHLIMHSHVDPGWLLTFEEYYEQQTKFILDETVSALTKYSDLRFIWSEISFLERWWKDATEIQKKQIKELITSGRLEITGGAWVMTDEATPTFYSAIENLIEGHQWINNTFGIRPNVSWSVDPFGHGSMLPHLLPYSGIDYMVIGRYHEHLKAELRLKQSLRWKWVDKYSQRTTGPLINSLPYFVYTTEYACENNQLCRCYNVGPNSRMPCFGAQLNTATNETIGNFTLAWLDQMRKAQSVYGTEDMLVAIGDDFYFQKKEDFDEFYYYYNWMAEWLNEHAEYNTEMKFSTVSEFFSSIRDNSVPSLKGDLFPYTSNMNNPDPWWTGYFAHRPHSKIMERILQNSLRSLDIVSSLNKKVVNFDKMRDAKRNFSIFQHHDGITGTSKPLVVKDYELRMEQSFNAFQELFGETLLNMEKTKLIYGINNRELYTINGDKSKNLVFFNPSTQSTNKLLKFKNSAIVDVFHNAAQVDSQWSKDGKDYTISFFYQLCPLTYTTFEIRKSKRNQQKANISHAISMDEKNIVEGVRIENRWNNLRIELYEYMDDGGAYVMDLNRKTSIEILPSSVKTEDGPLYSRKIIKYGNKTTSHPKMHVTVYKDTSRIDIEVETDLADSTTLMMKLKTDIKNENVFYTDVNNLYHVKRTYQNSKTLGLIAYDLPYEANFYPVSASFFIQDLKQRLTLLTGQPTGATSDKEGEVSVIIDRRVPADDGKGLGNEDGYDNRMSRVKHSLMFETRTNVKEDLPSPALSLKVSNELDGLLYPPIGLYTENAVENGDCLAWKWPCSIQLVSFRPLNEKTALLVLRRIPFDQSLPAEGCSKDLVPLFDFLSQRSLHLSSLTGTVAGELVDLQEFKNSLQDPYTLASFTLSL